MKYILISSKSKEASIMYRGIDIQDRYSHITLENRKVMDRAAKKYLNPKRTWKSKIIRWILTDSVFRKIRRDIIIKTGDNLCIIVMARVYEIYGDALVKFIRDTYPGSKVVCYFLDLVQTFTVDLDDYKNAFDQLYTFDLKQAEKYKMKYCMEPFSFYKVLKNDKIYDVTFVGKAKGRLDEIHEIYEALVKRGFICDFHIVGVKKGKQKYKDHITYNKFMDFETILEHVSKSHCVLEVMQDGAYSPTTRYTEAMLYGVNLLSDCKSIGTDRYPADSNVCIFTDINNIDYDFIRRTNVIERNKYIEFFSMEKFLDSIEEGLDDN